MGKVLISFLGTGRRIEDRKYQTATYKIGEETYTSSFVSSALSEHLSINRRITLGTAKSMWEAYYEYFAIKENTFDEDYYCVLGDYCQMAKEDTDDVTIIEELNKRLTGTSVLLLKYGLNEAELRYNISQVLNIEQLLEPNDEVYVDITHGFRSFPVLAQQIIFYLKEISKKSICVKGFYYGMLDAISDLKYAPVVDMKVLLEMNDWLIGASEFKNNADGTLIHNLLKNRENELAKRVDNFSKSVKINYAHEIKNQISQLSKLDLGDIKNPEKLILENVFNDFTGRFNNITRTSFFQLELANWYFDKKYYGSSYVILTEAILSYLTEEIHGLDKVSDTDSRKDVKPREGNPYLKKYKELYDLYKVVNKIRNNVAHNLNKRHDSFLNDIANLDNRIKKARKLFTQESR